MDKRPPGRPPKAGERLGVRIELRATDEERDERPLLRLRDRHPDFAEDLVQRRDVNFAFFRFTIRVCPSNGASTGFLTL